MIELRLGLELVAAHQKKLGTVVGRALFRASAITAFTLITALLHNEYEQSSKGAGPRVIRYEWIEADETSGGG